MRRVRARSCIAQGKRAGATGLEPAASGLTGQRDNQLRHAPVTVNVAVRAGGVKRRRCALGSLTCRSGPWYFPLVEIHHPHRKSNAITRVEKSADRKRERPSPIRWRRGMNPILSSMASASSSWSSSSSPSSWPARADRCRRGIGGREQYRLRLIQGQRHYLLPGELFRAAEGQDREPVQEQLGQPEHGGHGPGSLVPGVHQYCGAHRHSRRRQSRAASRSPKTPSTRRSSTIPPTSTRTASSAKAGTRQPLPRRRPTRAG